MASLGRWRAGAATMGMELDGGGAGKSRPDGRTEAAMSVIRSRDVRRKREPSQRRDPTQSAVRGNLRSEKGRRKKRLMDVHYCDEKEKKVHE